jgi:5-(aminomethyl)-3-furanmethanol phosphate kinase
MVDIVVKIGGALLGYVVDFLGVLAEIDSAARTRRILIVPGGGPFADAVRTVDRRFRLSDDAAHWMAVLAMDQYAWAIADRLGTGVPVSDRDAIRAALEAGRLPVLAPFNWMRQVDPLPHSWDVTSDSIAAWVTSQVGASRLVLVKPSGASARGEAALVDGYFAQTLPAGVKSVIVAADRRDDLRTQLFD